MTVTASTRLGLTRWSAGTDPFTRAQMDASFAALDNLVAIDMQGLLSARPAAAVRGRYYWATDVNGGTLSRDTGAAWVNVGSVTYAVPAPSAVGDTAVEGAATAVSRSDHKHAREAFGAVTVYTSGQASGNGAATTVARSDHAHGFPAVGGTPTAVTPGAAAASGSGSSVALSNHQHSVPAFGAAVTSEVTWGVAAAVGIATTLARADHTHGSPTTPVTSIAATGASTVSAGTGAVSVTSPAYATDTPAANPFGGAGTVGTTVSGMARGNHAHPMPAYGSVATATTFGISAADGTATTVARSDHAHGTPPAPVKTVRIPHTFAVPGDILTPSGSDNVIPGFFVPVPAGQTATLTLVRHVLGAGGTVTVGVYRNSALLGATFSVNTTATTYVIPDTALADGDRLSLVVSSPVSSPKNMTVSLYVDYTV